MRRINTASDLGAVLDEATIQQAQERLEHSCWVVCQRWGKDTLANQPELYGTFASAMEAMTERDRLHKLSLEATQWIEMHGEPTTEVVPVWKPGE